MITIPEPPSTYTVPPFDELTMLVFGIPGSGKTRFCAGCPNTLFLGTEPGQDFTKARVIAIRDWDHFKQICQTIASLKDQGRHDVQTVVIDIVDNLYQLCRDSICRQKGVDYPPKNDFGRTWSEITKEWSGWMRILLDLVNVRFISHTTQRDIEITNENGLKEETEVSIPTFSGNKAAQYLDGVVNAMGFMLKDKGGNHCITFKQSPRVAAKDRTDILAKLGDIKLPANPDHGWQYVAQYYAKAAQELGFEIKSRRQQ